ncbi:MAG: hypothetical protein MUC30_07740 [Bacteroidales bacterium]|nr:hypothetical protein [Bacteroidales bacterium]
MVDIRRRLHLRLLTLLPKGEAAAVHGQVQGGKEPRRGDTAAEGINDMIFRIC